MPMAKQLSCIASELEPTPRESKMVVVERVEQLNRVALESINQHIEVLEVECVELKEKTSMPNNVGSKEYAE